MEEQCTSRSFTSRQSSCGIVSLSNLRRVMFQTGLSEWKCSGRDLLDEGTSRWPSVLEGGGVPPGTDLYPQKSFQVSTILRPRC
jgi:hypothetical protein